MEKIRVCIPKSVYEEWIDVCEIGGQMIRFRKMLSYEEMVAFATEYVQLACVIDTEAQVAYEAHENDKIKNYLTLKYASNVDLDEIENPMGYAVDLLQLVNREDEDYQLGDTNIRNALMLCSDFMRSTIEIYEKHHALGTKISKAFGSLLDGGDVVKEIVESRGVSEQLIDFIQNKEEANDNVMLFKQFAKRDE